MTSCNGNTTLKKRKSEANARPSSQPGTGGGSTSQIFIFTFHFKDAPLASGGLVWPKGYLRSERKKKSNRLYIENPIKILGSALAHTFTIQTLALRENYYGRQVFCEAAITDSRFSKSQWSIFCTFLFIFHSPGVACLGLAFLYHSIFRWSFFYATKEDTQPRRTL